MNHNERVNAYKRAMEPWISCSAGRDVSHFHICKAHSHVRTIRYIYVELITQRRKCKTAALAEFEWDQDLIAAVTIVSAERLARNSFRYRASSLNPRTPFSVAHLTDIEKIDQKCKSGFKRRGKAKKRKRS